MEDLIMNSRGLVYYIVDNKYAWYHRFNDTLREDLASEGMIMLVQSAKNFDESKGVKFATFAYKYIVWGIQKYLNMERYGVQDNLSAKTRKDIQISSYDSGDTGTLIEACGGTEDEEIALMEFWEIVNECNIKDIKKIIKYREQGLNYREIAKLIGVSHQMVNVRLNQLKTYLSPYYDTEGYRGVNMHKKRGGK